MNNCIHCMEQLGGDASVCVKCNMEQNYECPVHHLKPGTVLLGRYLIGKALGEGGFGITYIGRDMNLDMRIAIKEYYPSGFSTRNHKYSNTVTLTQAGNSDSYEKEMQRFLHEAQTLAKFNDEPGIVGVRDFFRENGTAYIVMDYLEGITLKNYIRQNGRMPADKVFSLMNPVMQALSRIHSRGLIHRDISPDNIMVLKNGTVKLLDFGAARDVTADKSLSVVLKPGYAPEEQYRTKGEQGPWTDVYALCATMYKCITGITPDESLERAYDDNLKAPSDLGISILPAQEKVLLQGLRVRRSERIQNMDALRQGLLTADDKEQTRSIHIQWQVEDDEVKTIYQPKSVERAQPEEPEKTVYQPQQSEGKVSVKLAAELVTAGKKKTGKKEKKFDSRKSLAKKAGGKVKQEPTKNKKLRLRIIIGGAVAILAVVLTLMLRVPKEKVTAIAGSDAYFLTQVGQIEDRDRSIEISYQSIRDSVNGSDAFQLLNYLGEPVTGGAYTDVKYLGYGLYAATNSPVDSEGICPEVNRVSLVDSQGNVLIPGGACLISRPYEQENTDSRYLAVYYATEKTANKDECFVCMSQHGDVYTTPLDNGTMYKGYIKVYDLEKNRFVEDIPEIKEIYDVRVCGNSLVIGDYTDAVMYDSEGKVLVSGGISNVGDGILITSNDGTYRVYDENGTQTYYANRYVGLVEDSQYITMDMDGKDVVLDRNGNVILDAVYSQILGEHNGVFCVGNNGKYGLVTVDGKELVPCRYKWISAVEGDDFSGTYFYCKNGDKYTLVGENGVIATKLSSTSSGLAIVQHSNALVLNKRTFDLNLGESRHTELTHAMMAVRSETDGLYGVYDLYTGMQLLSCEYEAVAYAAGYLYAYKNGSWEIYEISYSK